ncbi:MAG: hypothetical protein IKH92_04275 [Clostridiales bacterium]|nr:hypothetical protein [Clostridiales bacterium]
MKKQRQMVQIIVTILVCSFVFSACSKSKKTSGLKITSIESALSETSLDSIKFSKKKSDDGYTFDAKDPSSLYDISYSAVADSKENISSITIINKDVNTSYLTDGDAFKELMKTRDFRLAELKAAICSMQVMQLEEAFGKDTHSMTENDWISELQPLFQGKKITVGEWTIEAEVDKSGETVVIKAYFN